jgi:hypothetical protein
MGTDVVTLVSKSAPAGAGSSGMATVRRQARLQSPPLLTRRILLHLHGPSSRAVLLETLVPVVQQVGQNKRMSKWVYVWRIGAELAFRFEPNPINRSHAPFPAYPISPARRALSSRMWRSAQRLQLHVPTTESMSSRRDRTRRRACDGNSPSTLPDPLRPFPPCFELSRSPETGPHTRRSLAAGRHFRAFTFCLFFTWGQLAPHSD